MVGASGARGGRKSLAVLSADMCRHHDMARSAVMGPDYRFLTHYILCPVPF